MGWMDAEGYLYLTDRQTDMILVGGANVYPAEIEAALDAHPHVRSARWTPKTGQSWTPGSRPVR
jgi:bile acid-coenzyme A ligase